MGDQNRRQITPPANIAQQIEAYAPLQPRAIRGTPIDGMLLTDANVDHLGGLAVLRQSGDYRFIVRSSAVVRTTRSPNPGNVDCGRNSEV